jgi:RimJ/RimL family protein N-acetyltransferase
LTPSVGNPSHALVKSPHPFLRFWRDDDLPRFQALHAEPDIAHWLGGALTPEIAALVFERTRDFLSQNGWGVWVVQDSAGDLVGAAGLQQVRSGMPFHPGIEATWRLHPSARGRGLITEAMRAVLRDAFTRLPAEELVTYTSRGNFASQRVMDRLGFTRDPARDFMHPLLESNHPLRPHVFFTLRRPAG